MVEQIYTVDETADVLRVKKYVIYRAIHGGRLAGAFRIGVGGRTSPWRIPEGAIEAYMKANAHVPRRSGWTVR